MMRKLVPIKDEIQASTMLSPVLPFAEHFEEPSLKPDWLFKCEPAE